MKKNPNVLLMSKNESIKEIVRDNLPQEYFTLKNTPDLKGTLKSFHWVEVLCFDIDGDPEWIKTMENIREYHSFLPPYFLPAIILSEDYNNKDLTKLVSQGIYSCLEIPEGMSRLRHKVEEAREMRKSIEDELSDPSYYQELILATETAMRAYELSVQRGTPNPYLQKIAYKLTEIIYLINPKDPRMKRSIGDGATEGGVDIVDPFPEEINSFSKDK